MAAPFLVACACLRGSHLYAVVLFPAVGTGELPGLGGVFGKEKFLHSRPEPGAAGRAEVLRVAVVVPGEEQADHNGHGKANHKWLPDPLDDPEDQAGDLEQVHDDAPGDHHPVDFPQFSFVFS